MRVRKIVQWIAVIVVCAVSLFGQSIRSQIVVDDPRPVASAAERLEVLYSEVITYEDPQWAVPSETKDVTDLVRRDTVGLSPAMRAKLPRVLIPKGGRLLFSVPGTTDSNLGSPFGMLQDILAENSTAGNPGRFRVLESNGQLHIIPAIDPNHRHVLPLLDARISIEYKTRSVLEMLENICDQLSTTTGERVVIGTIPVNAFANHTGSYGASGQIARDSLSSVLQSVGPRYSWQLFFDPGIRMYALNIHWVSDSAQ